MFRYLLPALFAAGLAAADPLRITAYIHVQSGCQRPTEALLARIDETYGDKVALEVVDFGTPAGMKRLKQDGMNCMGVRLDGELEAEIIFRGVPLKVSFMRPAGFFWTHEELETAVRQRIEGVAKEDRLPPQATTSADGEKTTLLIGGQPVYTGTDAPALQTAAETLNRLAKEKPLIQEEFTMDDTTAGRLALQAREANILAVEATDEAPAELAPILSAYPRIARPFPGAATPAGVLGRN